MSHIIQINGPFAGEMFPAELPPELMGRIADHLLPEERIALANTCKRIKNLQEVILSPPQKLLKEIRSREIKVDRKVNCMIFGGTPIALFGFSLLILNGFRLANGSQGADKMHQVLGVIVGVIMYVVVPVGCAVMSDRCWGSELKKIKDLKEALEMLRLQEPERIRRGRLSSSVTIEILNESTPLIS